MGPEPNSNLHPADEHADTQLRVTGMTCANCARHVAEALRGVDGVAGATVSLESNRATVRWNQRPRPELITNAVKAAGYTAELLDETSTRTGRLAERSAMDGWRLNVAVGAACTLPIMAGEWLFQLGPARWFQWVAFLLASVAQVVCGTRFYRGAWSQLKRGHSNMDTLVALGSTTAYGYSLWALLARAPGHLYFMEAAAILTLISLGHWLEARTSRHAESALRGLLDLAPQTARKRNEDGSESDVPVSVLNPGDVVVLRPGDRIPVDGHVIEGESSVDESMLTGESIPVDKSPGNTLYAGTCNLNGRLALRITAAGEQTALAGIIKTVRQAQESRAHIQRLGDRVSSIFVPIVILIALGTALWWGLAPEHAQRASGWFSMYLWPTALPESALAAAFIHAAAVLIIACPCAMGLATPVAIMAGANAAARRGILIRDGHAIEQAGKITAVVLDKTGTLTEGKPSVANVETYYAGGRRPVIHEMKLAAALARPSSHPFSQAIAKLYPDNFPITDWEEVRGSGVQGRLVISNYSKPFAVVRLGSLRWLRESGVNMTRGETFAREWASRGGTVLGVAVDNWLLGLAAVEDALKPGAAEVVRELQRAGLKVYLVSGDNELTAAGIAKQAGIRRENVFAEVRPEQKAAFVKQLQDQGARVAFVGDGINDAPAMETADLGIAVCRAADVTREAADILLLKSDIDAVPESLGMARATLRTIKQNLFWAFFYNIAAIPLAALGFLSPVVCAAVMGGSDLVVIGNALRLRRWKRLSLGNIARRLTKDIELSNPAHH